MADPRDLVLGGFQTIGQGFAQVDANQAREKMLNQPIPEWTARQMVGSDPSPGLAANVRAAAPNYSPGIGGAPWANTTGQPKQWTPPDAATVGQPAAPGMGGLPPELEAAAHAYASGAADFNTAFEQAKKYTMRDIPGLQFGLDVKRSDQQGARDEASLRREEEISRRVLAGLDKTGEQGEAANDTKKEVARIKAEADRDRAAVTAHARIKAAELALEGALARAKQMGIAAAGKNDPRLLRLKGLQLQLKAAEEKLQSATRGYTSDVSFVDEGERSKNDALVRQATAEIAGVQQQIQAVNEELGSGATTNGQAPFQMKVPPGSPPPPGMEGANVIEPPAPQGAVGPPPRLPMGGAVNPGAPAGFTGNEARNPKQHGIYGPDGKLLAPAQAAPPLPTGAAVLDQSGINTAAQVGKTKKVGTKTFVWNGQEWIREGSR